MPPNPSLQRTRLRSPLNSISLGRVTAMHPFEFSLSLRLRHPSVAPSHISRTLRMKPSTQWRAGTPRRTPKGTLLAGRRAETYWSTRITRGFVSSKQSSLVTALAQLAQRLERHSAFFKVFHATGGTSECYLSLFGRHNFGEVLPHESLRTLSTQGISLALDVYPQ